MAFYRDLDVDGKTYQYHIGRDFVKIKGIPGNNNVPIDDVGFRGIVKPAMIRNFILGIPNKAEDHFQTCSCNAPKRVGCLPFDAEIYEKYHYVNYCEECFDRNAEDI